MKPASNWLINGSVPANPPTSSDDVVIHTSGFPDVGLNGVNTNAIAAKINEAHGGLLKVESGSSLTVGSPPNPACSRTSPLGDHSYVYGTLTFNCDTTCRLGTARWS